MTVEPATLDDLDRLTDLWVALAAEQRDHGSHLAAEGNRAVMREALAAHVVDHSCLVARASGGDGSGDDDGRGGDGNGDRVLGFVSFDLERDGLDRDVARGTIQNLYVVPGARGEGHGGALLDAAEAALEAAGADRVVLEAMAANAEARAFYEARGYGPHRIAYERRTT